jgi:uncharacterized protein
MIGTLREEVWSRGRLCSRVRAGKAEPGAKFADYFEFSEPLAKLPSHRILALFRGEKEEILTLELVPDPAASDRGEQSAFERQIASRFKVADHGRPGDRWLIDTVRLAWRTRILVHIESDLRLRLWQAAEDAAVQVFAGNLRDLLLAAPAGARATMGLDPGYRTGVKVAVVTRTGQVAATATIYPHEPRRAGAVGTPTGTECDGRRGAPWKCRARPAHPPTGTKSYTPTPCTMRNLHGPSASPCT